MSMPTVGVDSGLMVSHRLGRPPKSMSITVTKCGHRLGGRFLKKIGLILLIGNSLLCGVCGDTALCDWWPKKKTDEGADQNLH